MALSLEAGNRNGVTLCENFFNRKNTYDANTVKYGKKYVDNKKKNKSYWD